MRSTPGLRGLNTLAGLRGHDLVGLALAASGVAASVVLPPGMSLRSVRFLTPEQPQGWPVDAAVADGRARFTLPQFLVYGVARLELEPRR